MRRNGWRFRGGWRGVKEKGGKEDDCVKTVGFWRLGLE